MSHYVSFIKTCKTINQHPYLVVVLDDLMAPLKNGGKSTLTLGNFTTGFDLSQGQGPLSRMGKRKGNSP